MDKSIAPVNQLAVRSSTCYEFSNSNGAVVVEIEDEDISVEAVEKQMEELKLDYRFNEEDVPRLFKSLINKQSENLEEIEVHFSDHYCVMIFDDIEVYMEERGNEWLIHYNRYRETFRTDDPEKSVIDHLWFVLKNPNANIQVFEIDTLNELKLDLYYHEVINYHIPKSSLGRLSRLLQSMLDSIDHHFHFTRFYCKGFNEDTFLSMLKHVKPGTLEFIVFNISWKEEGNYQKLEEIVGTDQWRRAERIFSHGVVPLRIENVLHCKTFLFTFDEITPEDVLRARELFIASTNCKIWLLSVEKNRNLDIESIREVLLPNSVDESASDEDGLVYTYKLPNSSDFFSVKLKKDFIRLTKNSD